MRCEVCGRKINSKPFNVIIEGAKLTVCFECSKLGKIYYEEPKPKTLPPKPKTTHAALMIQVTKKPQAPKVDSTMELVPDFGAKIRQAREQLGLSHEDLGRKINEKVSVLRKIETGKMTPDNRLATLLERVLKIKLIVPAKEEKAPPTTIVKASNQGLTLGDMIQLGKDSKRKEDHIERGQS